MKRAGSVSDHMLSMVLEGEDLVNEESGLERVIVAHCYEG